MIRLLRAVWRDLRYVVTGTRPTFEGDAFTRWLTEQRIAAERGRTNPVADDLYGPPPPVKRRER